jgi:hypothetical protein
MSAQLDFLRDPPPPDPAPTAVTPTQNRKRKARDIQVAGARRWILAGMPIAVQVAKDRDFVTAETFRAAAEKLGALPPTYGEQRALSWIPSMFLKLCNEGLLQKRRRTDGSVVKVYSEEQGNDQVVYEIPK